MKRTLTLVTTMLMTAVAAMAQSETTTTRTLTVDEGAVQWVYDVDLIGAPMPFAANTLTIAEHAYTLGDQTTLTIAQGSVTDNTVVVTYADGGARVVAPGALAGLLTISVSGQNVDITASPALADEVSYILSGTGETFALHGDYKSTIVLQGVTLAAKGEQPALWIDNGKRIDFIAADGTQNAFADVAGNQKKSAFHVKGHAEWKGGGDVTITGSSRHAYSSNEYTLFKPSFTGTFTVPAAGSDGMHIDQYLEVNGGTITISGTKGDGIDISCTYEDDGVTKTQDEKNGQFIMNGGTITVTVDADDTKGLKSEGMMTITAGRINAIANGAGCRGIQTADNFYLGTEGATDLAAAYVCLTAKGGDYTDPETDDVNKCRGLKVKQNLTLYPSTLERTLDSTVKAKKVVDVDGTYLNRGGKLLNITIE